jgi:hypothetical protein
MDEQLDIKIIHDISRLKMIFFSYDVSRIRRSSSYISNIDITYISIHARFSLQIN